MNAVVFPFKEVAVSCGPLATRLAVEMKGEHMVSTAGFDRNFGLWLSESKVAE